MARTIEEKRSQFRALHHAGCFLLPNPWDIGSARLLAQLGFSALASSSAGFAWTQGRPDYAVTRDGVLEHLRALNEAVDVPINADFESGFAHEPEAVARNVQLAARAGVAGLSVEDRNVRALDQLYDTSFAAERIRAARQALDASADSVVLVARTEILLIDPTAVRAATDKLIAFAEAGADCLYAPGVTNTADIASLVRAVAPKPLNVLQARPGLRLAQLRDLGVRRVSVGGALARVAWGAVIAAAEQLRAGSFDGLANAAPHRKLNQAFGSFD